MYLEGSDQHRGWFQSSLLEVLRHARARALRRGAHPRLPPRREGRGEDEQVEGQRALAAGPDEDLRRRHPAAVGGVVGLFERHPFRARHPAGHGRILPQAQEHAALDARHARALRRRAAGRARRHAGAGAADAASPGRAGRDHPRGLRGLRLQARGGGAVALHEHRPVRVLRRHPQGRALLRALSRRPSAAPRWRPSSRSSAAPACGWRR